METAGRREKWIMVCIATLVLLGLCSRIFAEEVLFFEDFSTGIIDAEKWDILIDDPAESTLTIESERLKADFWGGFGSSKSCYLAAKPVSLPSTWSVIHLRGTWGYGLGTTGEGRVMIYTDDAPGQYVRIGCGSWQGPFLTYGDSCGHSGSDYSYSFPTIMTPFEFIIDRQGNWQYLENDVVLAGDTCAALGDLETIRFKMGGWDMSHYETIYYFDDIELTVVNQGDSALDPVIIDTVPATISGSTCDFQDDYDGCCGDDNSGPDVIFRYDAAEDVEVDVVLADSAYDTRLYVYENDITNPANCLGCSNDDINGNRSILHNLAFTAGNAYYIGVDGDNAACGDYILYIFESVDPDNTTWYVKPDGNDYNSGSSWETALEHIQAAINKTATGHTVIVADGIYTGAGNKSLAWGGEGQVKHITVKSANGPDNCIIDSENSGNGFDFYNRFLNSTDVIDGFTIRNGLVDQGGGIRCWYNTSPTIQNCIFLNNTSNYTGGGISCFHNSYPTLRNCQFLSNHAKLGGAISCGGGNNIIEDCIMIGNTTWSDAGAVRCDSCSPSFNRCLIAANTTTGNGGGFYCSNSASPYIRNCTITGNHAGSGGGAISCSTACYPVIINSILWGNTAASRGPQIALYGFSPDASHLTISYSDVAGGNAQVYRQTTSSYVSWGLGCFDANPQFVSAATNDYHLKSEGWRYNELNNSWTWDDVTSRCIDAGCPGSDLSAELACVLRDPDNLYGVNLRVNMGFYGTTAQASIPPHDWAWCSDINTDGTVDLQDYAILAHRWLQTGAELPCDLDRSDIIDILDIVILSDEWLKTTTWH